MKTAFGVELKNSARKTQDQKDIVNYQIWIQDTRYYSKDADRVKGEFPNTVRLARPMSHECAKALASQLKGTAQSVQVVELLTDDDQFLPETLEELKSPVDEPLGITALKSAVKQCLGSGMPVSEVLDICKSEVFGADRLRAAIQGLVDKKVKDEDILAVVNHAVNG
jgi:hypothetical protein